MGSSEMRSPNALRTHKCVDVVVVVVVVDFCACIKHTSGERSTLSIKKNVVIIVIIDIVANVVDVAL